MLVVQNSIYWFTVNLFEIAGQWTDNNQRRKNRGRTNWLLAGTSTFWVNITMKGPQTNTKCFTLLGADRKWCLEMLEEAIFYHAATNVHRGRTWEFLPVSSRTQTKCSEDASGCKPHGRCVRYNFCLLSEFNLIKKFYGLIFEPKSSNHLRLLYVCINQTILLQVSFGRCAQSPYASDKRNGHFQTWRWYTRRQAKYCRNIILNSTKSKHRKKASLQVSPRMMCNQLSTENQRCRPFSY